jgi:glycerol kinase
VQWLRDGLRLFQHAPEIEELAARSDAAEPVVFVPGFVGLGAPHWVPQARGVLFGLTRGTTKADLGRATLEGVALQVADLIEAAGMDAVQRLHSLRVDGGMARNVWFLQCQADLLGLTVLQSPIAEATALGAAYLAGLQSGVWKSEEQLRALATGSRSFEPRLSVEERQRRVQLWKRAVRAVIEFYSSN